METFIHLTCPTCNKKVSILKEVKKEKYTIRVFSCLHAETVKIEKSSIEEIMSITALNGNQPFKFQAEGVEFFERAQGRALCADQMGLGKTVQFLAYTRKNPKKRWLIVCKSALMLQWQMMIFNWTGEPSCILEKGSHKPLNGFRFYIVSYDLLRRLQVEKCWKSESNPSGTHLDGICCDEVQQIKNVQTARAISLRQIIKIFPKAEIIGLSGTPIENNAGEFFSFLNMMKPELFPIKERFITKWCQWIRTDFGYKIGGIQHIPEWRDFTKDFIIRRTRDEVEQQLPVLNRSFHFCDLSKEVENAYRLQMEGFVKLSEESGLSAFEKGAKTLAFLARMRHLTGISKTLITMDLIEEFLTSTDRKLAIFVHHKDVGALIAMKAKELTVRLGISEPVVFTSDMDKEARDKAVFDFTSNGRRLFIGSTLAAGEGLNLQACSDAILVERQWNPSKEEQAEARFLRLGSLAKHVDVRYIIAYGTIDEHLTEIVERKRTAVASALDGKEIEWEEAAVIKELTDILLTKGAKKWLSD